MNNDTFDIIVAIDRDFGIGKAGEVPWRLPGELKYFREVTTRVSSKEKRNAVVMGRKTWESIPLKFRPLPERLNIVMSRDPAFVPGEGAQAVQSIDEALQQCERQAGLEHVFVIGGAEIYEKAILHPRCTGLYVTRIDEQFGCDIFFPKTWPYFMRVFQSPVCREGDITYVFEKYERPPEPPQD